jgi:hypothetical protein
MGDPDRLDGLSGHRLVFVAGLHRSGTTPLARVLAGHPDIAGFQGTSATEDEGQHLQSVYPAARTYGGPGRFALNPAAHLTEESPLVSPENRQRLLEAWTPHWDLSKPVLVEKSPPNLVMTRFLQALFPDAYHVAVVRHPVVVSLSTKKWTRTTSLHGLMKHWFAAHDLFRADAGHVKRLLVISYESLIARPAQTLAQVGEFLELNSPIPADGIRADRSTAYEQAWDAMASGSFLDRARRRRIEADFAGRAAEYGYDLNDLATAGPFPLPPT